MSENSAIPADAPQTGPAPSPRRTRGYGALLTIGGLLGLVAAFELSVDEYRILEDPSYSPACDLNPVLSCGSVMSTPQASVFGFPNPLLGLVAFSALVALGVVLLAGVRLPRWVLGGIAAGSLAGAAFVHWLAFQTMYRIGALCPWCLLVWAVVLPLCVWSVLTFLRTGSPGRLIEALWRWRFSLTVAWGLVFVVAALERFWDYWRTLL